QHRADPGQILWRQHLGGIATDVQRGLVQLVARQVDLERRAAPGRAVDENEAASLPDDTVDGRQAEPGAGPDLFRREKRLEDAGEMFVGDADSGIGDLYQHIVARRHELVSAAHRARLADIGGADRQGSAALHRVTRIDGQIDDDLFELALVDLR